MIGEFLSVVLLLQSASGGIGAAKPIDPYLLCVCPAKAPTDTVKFTGYAQDAVLTLGADGRSAEDRQATVFRVARGPASLGKQTKVFHLTRPDKCGVSFDYGRRYDVLAVKKGETLETDWCLMGKPKTPVAR